jgi:predicted metal-dependent hydrolase
MSDAEIRDVIQSKLPWIKKNREKLKYLEPKPTINWMTGERHPFFGKSYSLNVWETTGKQGAVLREDTYIDLYVKKGSTREKRQKVLNEWYREELKRVIPSYISKWEPMMGVSVKEFRIKQMKTRWGTCNIREHRIWINLELAKRNPRCLEYIVVHEMVHLLERNHNGIFKAYMTKFLPDWKNIREELKL